MSSITVVGLTDEAVAEARAIIGVPLKIEQYSHEASLDTIRHFAHGIGDDNPLFTDEDYAARSPYGTVIAPPTFPYAIFSTIIMPCLPGIQGVYGRAEWTFDRRILRNERIRAEAKVIDTVEKHGRRSGRFLIQLGEAVYFDSNGRRVARVLIHNVRVPRAGADGGGLHHPPRDSYVYSDEELLRIEEDVFAEQVRGSVARYGDDVLPGDRVGPVVKGPLELQDQLSWYTASLPDNYHSTERRWKMKRHATTTNLDPRRYQQVNSGYGHQNTDMARAVGMPNAYDNGCQRVSFFGHLLSNWCGDLGFVAALDIQHHEPNLFGDTIWLTGAIDAVTRAAEGWEVTLSVDATNQVGGRVSSGSAVVLLPARDAADRIPCWPQPTR